MMKSFLFVSLILAIFPERAFAQVIDMRAASLQRGFKAYRVPVPAAQPEPALSNDSWPLREQTAQTELPSQSRHAALQSQSGETSSQIQQKGLKIFQEKDESKVMNFDVENPEFKKLNKQQQQDLLNRITFE